MLVSSPPSRLALLLLQLVLLGACGGERSPHSPVPGPGPGLGNKAPLVETPSALNLDERSPLTLTATASDSDGRIAAVTWEQTAGPPVTLTGSTTLTPALVAPTVREATKLTFRVTVQDETGATAQDQVTVTVLPVAEPPVIQRLRIDPPTRRGIPIWVWAEDPDGDPVELTVEFSRDGGTGWSPARIEVTDVTSPGDAGAVSLRWRSVEDLGFREAGPVALRVTPTAPDLPGTPKLDSVTVDNLSAAAASVEHYAAYYGPLTATEIQALERYDLAVVHPYPSVQAGFAKRSAIADIQDGVDPQDPRDDVLVICYVAVGEDLRTVNLSDEQLAADPRFTDTSSTERGPRIDPRGTAAYTASLPLADISPLGLPSPGGTAFRSFYLDDVSLARGAADGIPDRNSVFGGAFVNAGDPAWFEEVNNMTSQRGEPPGLREMLTTTGGQGLGCDGVLLDAVDTAAPNSFSADSKFEWTAPGLSEFVARVRSSYPRALLLQNRGLFFFNPDLPHYVYNPGTALDFLLFESYRLDSQTSAEFSPPFFCDNKRNYMPKVVAQSQADGFKVLSLGYAEGPSDPVSGATLKDTLVGQSEYGFETLMADIREARDIAGFAHYLTSADLGLLNDFVRRNVATGDDRAPQWSSTFNDQLCTAEANTDLLPTPRAGLQRVKGVPGGVRLAWDVALDPSPVAYVLYFQQEPFDFSRADALAAAQKTELLPTIHRDYATTNADSRLAFESTLLGLEPVPYYFLLRSRDGATARNEDDNRVVLNTTPLP